MKLSRSGLNLIRIDFEIHFKTKVNDKKEACLHVIVIKESKYFHESC